VIATRPFVPWRNLDGLAAETIVGGVTRGAAVPFMGGLSKAGSL
jgi:hypothetical protein